MATGPLVRGRAGEARRHGSRAPLRRTRTATRRRVVAPAFAACVVLAAVSLLVPSAPTTDPWGWIVWGREVLDLDLDTRVGGAPSWKPLPILLTTPLSLAGGATPELWLLVSRALGLMSLVFAYRLASRLAGTAGASTAGRRTAGLVAAGGLVLSVNWLRGLAHGYTEPLALALLLAAVERHLEGRRGQALGLGALVALARPEAWALLVVYGVVLWRRSEVRGGRSIALLAVVPALWLVPDWIGSGNPFHGSEVANAVVDGDLLEALGGAALIAPPPLLVAAVGGAALAARRGDRPLPQLAAGVLGWVALLVILMVAGYPPSPRYFLLPAGVACVLGGAGAVLLVEAARGAGVRVALAGALAAAALPVAVARGHYAVDAARATVDRASLERDLETAIERAGPARLRQCGAPVLPLRLGWLRGLVAWRVRVSLGRTRGVTTSAPDVVEELSGDEGGGRTRLRAVAVGAPRGVPPAQPFVLFSPFGGARVSVRARPRRRLAEVARAGPWRVEVAYRARRAPRACPAPSRALAPSLHASSLGRGARSRRSP